MVVNGYAFDLKMESQILGRFVDTSLGPSYTVGYSKESSSLALPLPPLGLFLNLNS